MRKGFIINTLTTVDIQEIVRVGGKVIETYKVVIYRENYKISRFKKVIDNLFDLRQNYKDENNAVMQLLVKLMKNSLYGEQSRRGIEQSYEYKSENWMMTEYNERVLDYKKNFRDNYIVKLKDDSG